MYKPRIEIKIQAKCILYTLPVFKKYHISPHLDSGQPYPEPEPQPEPAPNQNYARVDDFSWKIGNTNMNANGLTDLRVFVNVTPTADTDTISGQNLWRIGVYGSRVREGVDGYQDRYDYNPQVYAPLSYCLRLGHVPCTE